MERLKCSRKAHTMSPYAADARPHFTYHHAAAAVAAAHICRSQVIIKDRLFVQINVDLLSNAHLS